MRVPFLDLKAQYESIKDEIAIAIQGVLDRTAFAGGPFVEAFEEKYAEFCQTKYALGVSSGTSALWLALTGLGIGAGDEVITIPNTFIATAEAISFCGAKPVFVDVDEQTFNMNSDLLEGAITEKTKAIIPVHLYGQMCDMDPIMAIAKKHGLFVIEDACQAHGAEYKGKRAGSIGDAGCFSFYPGKNLGAYGEAGAIVTNNADLTATINMLKDHGQEKKYYHSMVGWNARMDGFQGAILDVKLKHLVQWTDARRKNAALYKELLDPIDGIFAPEEAAYAKHVYHVYSIRVQDRDTIIPALAKREVFCGIHYPVPLHLQQAYESLGYKQGDFPVAEECCGKIMSLPMFPELSDDQIREVVTQLQQEMAVTV